MEIINTRLAMPKSKFYDGSIKGLFSVMMIFTLSLSACGGGGSSSGGGSANKFADECVSQKTISESERGGRIEFKNDCDFTINLAFHFNLTANLQKVVALAPGQSYEKFIFIDHYFACRAPYTPSLKSKGVVGVEEQCS